MENSIDGYSHETSAMEMNKLAPEQPTQNKERKHKIEKTEWAIQRARYVLTMI